ncbi:hypothetical protein DD556_17550 [Phaeobacter sp. JL2872]|jgi:type II secretory pathway component PulM|uniref:type II secretion system protein GspM n=1 Tax=Phaeobacter sp. JL2872 TaxID=2461377 RepID=UPI000D5EEF5D|nr:type II secretion system protein GspM [Phaeobacter sp. JL2872]MEE2635211.1 type II secretion system protein GspM [Pseudomonadota bacterium]PVZ45285.1 hypothetical protein DD556_17550 [Phaeobacter sp. JL2872]
MSARLIDRLLQLSGRERTLLALAAVLVPLGLAMTLLLPLQERRQAARIARSEAQDVQAWVRARIAEKQSLTQAIPAVSATPIGTSGVEQGLIAARLRPALSALSAEASGSIDLRFDRVDFAALAHWLTTAHPGWGYEITQLRMEALDADPGYVAAWISLSPAQR